jgi:hypothetical protein
MRAVLNREVTKRRRRCWRRQIPTGATAARSDLYTSIKQTAESKDRVCLLLLPPVASVEVGAVLAGRERSF